MTNQALTTTDHAVDAANAGAMSLAPTRQFSRQEITLLQSTIAKGLTMPEISLFVQASRHYGLDPFSRQIYAIKRGTGDRAQLTIQISIDGFRVIAERNPEYAGQTPPEFLDREGKWHEGIWLADVYPGIGLPGEEVGPFPLAARVGIMRKGWSAPVYGYAAWREYAQFTSQGLGDMWARMPGNQLAKCAESLGLRKAFPNDLSGAYSNDEMAQDPRPVNVEVEGMTLEQLTAGAEANTDEYAGGSSLPLEGEVIPPPANRRRAPQKSADEQEWERQHPPAQAAPRQPVAAARPAAQRAAPAPAAPVAPPDPRQSVKTVTQLMVWASVTYDMDEAAVLVACGVESKKGIQNLGLTKSIAAIEAASAAAFEEALAAGETANDDSAGAAAGADAEGDIDLDNLPF